MDRVNHGRSLAVFTARRYGCRATQWESVWVGWWKRREPSTALLAHTSPNN